MWTPPTKFWIQMAGPGVVPPAHIWCQRCQMRVTTNPGGLGAIAHDEVGCFCAVAAGYDALAAAGYDDESTYITPQMEQNYSLTFSPNQLGPTVPPGLAVQARALVLAQPFIGHDPLFDDIHPIQPMEPVPPPEELPEGRMIDFEDEE